MSTDITANLRLGQTHDELISALDFDPCGIERPADFGEEYAPVRRTKQKRQPSPAPRAERKPPAAKPVPAPVQAAELTQPSVRKSPAPQSRLDSMRRTEPVTAPRRGLFQAQRGTPPAAFDMGLVPGEEAAAAIDGKRGSVAMRDVQLSEPRVLSRPPAEARSEPRRAGGRLPRFTGGVISRLLRIAMPVLAISLAVGFIALNFDTIGPVLLRFAAVWMVSFGGLLLLTRHHLDTSQICIAATILSIIVMLVLYNVFGLGCTFMGIISSMIGAVMSFILLLIGVRLLIGWFTR